VNSVLEALRKFGIGRVAMIGGVAAGVIAVLAAVMLRAGAEPKSLLYSNLDLREAASITAALDAAGTPYELKGDGSTILVDRNEVAATRLKLSAEGLPTSGSVGYEIFDERRHGPDRFRPAAEPPGAGRRARPHIRTLKGVTRRACTCAPSVSCSRRRRAALRHVSWARRAVRPGTFARCAIWWRAPSGLKADRVTLIDETQRAVASVAAGPDGFSRRHGRRPARARLRRA
jgi:flagellar M-ring protein FliF